MILTNCAACAAPLAHDHKKRCSRCKTRYCNEAYAIGKRVPVDSLAFFLDGSPISGDQTPEDVDMEDGDQIDVYEDAFSASLRAAKRPRSSPRQV